MPTIPDYSLPQVQQRAAPAQQFTIPQSPDIGGQQAQELSRGLMKTGSTAAAIGADMQMQANAARHDDAVNQLVDAGTKLRLEALQLKGRNALERPDGKALPDEYGEKLGQIRQQIAAGLGNDAQRAAFGRTADRYLTQFKGSLSSHMLQQQEAFADDTYKGTVETAANQGALLYGDPQTRQESYDTIRRAVEIQAQRKGWDDKTRDDELQHAVSPMHLGIMQSMIKGGRAADAKAYYDEHSSDMTIQARAGIQGALQSAVAAQKSDGVVGDVWGQIGPRTANDPVKLFDMEAVLREKLHDDPDTLKVAVADLRQRAQAFNAQQAEMKAGNTAAVWNLVDSGASLSAVQKSDAWLAMSGTEQHEILKAMDAEAYTRESRAAARASRAASDASRQLSQMQVSEKMEYMRNGDKYLTATDPAVLKNMSRAQVEALRTDFGMEPTQHLLQKWDELKNPGKLVEARMDQEDFNSIADQMGLHPFKIKEGDEAGKRALGTLKFRMEQMIDAEQSKLGKPMARQEKMDLMRREMARTVAVDHGWFSREKQVPVVSLTDDQAKDLVIPDDARKQIVAALRTKYQQNPNNPNFAPTEANVRRLFLLNASPAGAFVNVQ